MQSTVQPPVHPTAHPPGQPRFSVIIPAHDAEQFIGQCLESVLTQSFTDLEVLLVADSCTDATPDIARGLGVEPVEVSAGAPGLARNAALDRARGEYYLYLDADDYYLSRDALRILDAELAREPVDVLAFGFMAGGRLARPRDAAGKFLWNNMWSRAWRAQTFRHLRFGPERAGEDGLYDRAAARLRPSLRALDVPLVQYRHPRVGSLSAPLGTGALVWGQTVDGAAGAAGRAAS